MKHLTFFRLGEKKTPAMKKFWGIFLFVVYLSLHQTQAQDILEASFTNHTVDVNHIGIGKKTFARNISKLQRYEVTTTEADEFASKVPVSAMEGESFQSLYIVDYDNATTTSAGQTDDYTLTLKFPGGGTLIIDRDEHLGNHLGSVTVSEAPTSLDVEYDVDGCIFFDNYTFTGIVIKTINISEDLTCDSGTPPSPPVFLDIDVSYVKYDPAITAAGSTTFCLGEDVVLNATINSEFSYQWLRNSVNLAGATSASYLATQSGSYTCEVTSGGITVTTNAIVVTVNPLPIVSFSGLAPEYCINASPDPLTGSPTGGTSSFVGPGVVNGNIFNPANAGVGTHNISYFYSDGTCTNSQTQSVEVYALPNAVILPIDPPVLTFCAGDSEQLTATGGISYLWSTGETTSQITVNSPINYSVTVTDNNQCTDVASKLVSTLPVPSMVEEPDIQICNGDRVLRNLTAAGLGGVTFAWTVVAPPGVTGATDGTGSTIDNTLFNSSVSTPLKVTYTITPTFGTCDGTPEIWEVTVGAELSNATLSVADNSICEGESTNLFVNFTGGIGPYKVVISGLPDEDNYVSGSPIPISPSTTTAYNLVSVTDVALCTPGLLLGSPTVTVNPAPTSATLSLVGSGDICVGQSSQLKVDVVGGVGPYDLNISGHGIVNNYTSGDPFNVLPATTTTYGLTSVTDSGGCLAQTLSGDPTVNVHPVPLVDAGSDIILCDGDSFSRPLISTTATAFNWNVSYSNANILGVDIGGGSVLSYTLNNTGSVSGTATFTIIPSNAGCSGPSETLIVTVNPTPDATITPAAVPICVNNSASNLTAATAGGTWSGVGITDATLGTFDPAVAGVGTHTITYQFTDGNGCTGIDTEDIVVNPLPDATITPVGPFCLDQSPENLTAATMGGNWLGVGIVDAINGIFDPAVAGLGTHTITYQVADGNGCINFNTEDIVVIALPAGTINPAGPFCVDAASVNLTASTSGASWSGVGITNTIDGTFDPATAGVGSHEISYCADTETIIVKPKPVISAIPNPENIESGQTTGILLSSDQVGITTYTWNVLNQIGVTGTPISGATANVNVLFTLTGAVPGTAVVEAIGTFEGCLSNPLSVPVNVAIAPPVDPIANPVNVCNNNPAELTATGTGTLTWYNVAIGGTSIGVGSPFTTPAPITANTSFWVETVVGGLSSNRVEVPVTVINPAVITVLETTGTTCDVADGFVSFNYAGNGAGYHYEITPVGGNVPVHEGDAAPNTTINLNNLAVGTYDIKVEPDAPNCTSTTQFAIIDGSPTFAICAASVSCTAPADGTVTSEISITVSRLAPVSTGVFNYHIEDHIGNTVASGAGNFGVSIPTKPLLPYTGNDYTFVLETGAANNCVTAGRTIRIPRASYGVSADNADGIYEVCDINDPLTVVLTANLNTSSCPVAANQHSFVVERDGSPVIGTIVNNTNTLTNVEIGNYVVTATSTAAGFETCTATTFFVVKQKSLAVEVISTDPTCNDPLNADGKAVASATGGTPPHSYEWFIGTGIDITTATPISVLSSANGLSAGGYTLSVTDSKCTVPVIKEFTLTAPPPVGSVSIIQPVVGTCEVSAQLTGADVSRGPFTFFWILQEDVSKPVVVESMDGMGNTVYDFQEVTQSTENILFVEVVSPDVNGDIISTVSTLIVPSGTYIVRVQDNFGCTTETLPTPIATPADTRPPYQLCFRWTTDPQITPTPVQPAPQVTQVSLQALDIINGLEDQVERCVANRLAELDATIDQTCADPDKVNDELVFTYNVDQYHYTLYYYDRGGNLLKTIPPQGVMIDPLRDRSTVAVHNLPTTYEYNSLGQLINQNSPDGGPTSFVYNDLGQLRFSQNAKQADIGDDGETFSYTKYDALGRIIEVGESQVGVGYTAPDGAPYPAATFSSLEDEIIANLDKQFYQDGNLLYPDRDQVYPTPAQTLSEQTKTYYTESTTQADYFGKPQTYLRNRVSYVETFNLNGDRAATYYSYDPHDNVRWLIQDIPGLRRNYLAYDYDLISGNVLKVRYNEGLNDAFYHRYEYDEDNRLLAAYTSTNNQLWDRDARYEYYQHGPLRRTVMGQDRVQGMDYTYTIHGWLKAINHPDVANVDPGNDGDTNLTGKDAFGMTLGYYSGDFTANSSPFNNTHASHLSGTDLFNGNISSWTTGTFAPGDPNATNGYLAMSGRTFRYDKLNRIRTSKFNTYSAIWAEEATLFASTYDYDANGNLTSLERRNALGDLMDNLTYNYSIAQNNRLNYVTDAIADGVNTEDIDNQAIGNYSYDAIGNLVGDVQEDITKIDWTVYGKVSQIVKNIGGQNRITRFQYDAAGNRVKKSHEDIGGNITNTYYVRDASGNVMAVYDDVQETITGGFDVVYKLREQPVYGSDRLGQRNADYEVSRMRHIGSSLPTEVLVGLEVNAALKNWLLPVSSAEGSALAQLDMTNAPVLSGVTDRIGRGDLQQVAVAEDASGNLLFSLAVAQSLHGVNREVVVILDKAGHIMQGTSTIATGQLKANPSGQSLIARTLEDGMKYKIFTVGSDNKAYIHTVDMSIAGTGSAAAPNGAVISKNEPLDNTFDFVRGMTLMEDRQYECPIIRLYMLGYDPDAVPGTTTTMSLRHYAIAGATVSGGTLDSWDGYQSYGQLQLSKDASRLAVVTPQGLPLGWYNATNEGAELRVYEFNILENVVNSTKVIDLGDDLGINSIDFSADNDFVYYTTSSPESGHQIGRVDVAATSATPENLSTLNNYAQLRRGHNDNLYVTPSSGQLLTQIVHDVTTPVISSVDVSLDVAYSLTGVMPAQPLSLTQMGTVPNIFTRELGKYYELKDHLGNVRAVVTDKLSTEISGANIINYKSDFISYTDYYPFGAKMPGRSLNSSDYRYGFNGKEKDQSGEFGLTNYDFGARIYNPNIGKWLSRDRIIKPYSSPYLFGKNNPTTYLDPDGNDEIHFYFYLSDWLNEEGKIVIRVQIGFDVIKNNEDHTFFVHQFSKGRKVGSSEFFPFRGGTNLPNQSSFSAASRRLPLSDKSDCWWCLIEKNVDDYVYLGRLLTILPEIRDDYANDRPWFVGFDGAMRQVRSEDFAAKVQKVTEGGYMVYGAFQVLRAGGRFLLNKTVGNSKIIGTAQVTGTRGHAFVSQLIAIRYGLDPRVSRVTMDLGYKRLLGGGAFRYGPRPDVGVFFKSGRVKVFELGSKTDILKDLSKRNKNFMKDNLINGKVRVLSAPRYFNLVWPK